MTHLLKPNDNGLASLDEVRAWMETQTREMIESAASTMINDRPPVADNQFKYGEYITYPGEQHTVDEWNSILEERRVCPITLREIYQNATNKDNIENTRIAFSLVNRALHQGSMHGQYMLTGTSYNHNTKIIYDGAHGDPVNIPKEYTCFGLEGDAKKEMERFLQTLFWTTHSIAQIELTLEIITGGRTTLDIPQIRRKGPTDRLNRVPLTVSVKKYSANEAYMTIGLVESKNKNYGTIGVEHD